MHTTTKPLTPTGSQESLGSLLGDLMTHTADLIKGEIALVRADVRSKLLSYVSAALVAAVGVGFAFLASMALLTAGIVALAAYVGIVNSALICGALLGVFAAVFLSKGVGHLKRLST